MPPKKSHSEFTSEEFSRLMLSVLTCVVLWFDELEKGAKV